MIGSIPSFVDQEQYLSDHNLYPQPMYDPAFHEQSNGYGGSNPGSTYNASTGHSTYEYPLDGADQSSSLFEPRAAGFRQGSFADIGAAFGFHPDLPIQILSQSLPQSPSSHLESHPSTYQNIPQSFPHPPFSTIGQTAPDAYHPGWAGGRPRSESRYGKRQRRSHDDSDEDEGNELGDNVQDIRRPTRLWVCHTFEPSSY